MALKNKSVVSSSFDVFNSIFILTLGLLCLLPIIHILAVSLSDKAASAANMVGLWPVGFHLKAYEKVLTSLGFLNAFFITVKRTVAGTLFNMLLITITAYPLAREREEFKGRDVFMWLLFFTMLFSGGLIPTYLQVRNLGLLNNFWALILPLSVYEVFSIIIMMNFFRGLPKGLYEAAMMDGASHWKILFRIYIPLSMASIATLTLFSMVSHWNEWFFGFIYMTSEKNWPLQTYLRQILMPSATDRQINISDLEVLKHLSNRNLKAAQLFIAIVPIMAVYPFLQKYFVKGVVLGSVKE